MKINIYELLGMVKDEPDRSIYVKYFDRVNKKEDVMWACKGNIIYKLNQLIIELNDTVEILEEENKIPEKIPEKIIIGKKQPTHRIKKIEKKINEIITYLDYLKNKGDE